MIFYSDVRRRNADTITLGEAHYSYMFPADRIIGLFRRPHHLLRPEIFCDLSLQIAYPEVKQSASAPIHVAFRSFGDIRLLKGAHNVAHVPWEFSNLQLHNRPWRLWDQLFLLRKLDEIWTPSQFGAKVLSQHLDSPVLFIPTPIPVSKVKRRDLPPKNDLLARLGTVPALPLSLFFGANNTMQHKSLIQHLRLYAGDLSRTKVYLLVVNPGDWRKNIEKVVRCFAAFSDRHEDVLLLIKLVIDNKATRLDNVQQDTILPKMLDSTSLRSKKILFISANLSDDALCQLYQLADFYISISLGEGQNLPLLEAMGQGVVPISVDHTAMVDYITPNNAFVIPSAPKEIFNPELSEYTENGWAGVHDVTIPDCMNALEASYRASSVEVYDKCESAIATVQAIYSDDAVRSALGQTIAKDFLR